MKIFYIFFFSRYKVYTKKFHIASGFGLREYIKVFDIASSYKNMQINY